MDGVKESCIWVELVGTALIVIVSPSICTEGNTMQDDDDMVNIYPPPPFFNWTFYTSLVCSLGMLSCFYGYHPNIVHIIRQKRCNFVFHVRAFQRNSWLYSLNDYDEKRYGFYEYRFYKMHKQVWMWQVYWKVIEKKNSCSIVHAILILSCFIQFIVECELGLHFVLFGFVLASS